MRVAAVSVILVLIIGTFVPLALREEEVVSETDASIQYTPHSPIFIDGNEDFTSANGVTGGSGTESDPYVIEGWEIFTVMTAGVMVVNTNAHFTIRDCCFHGSGTIEYNPGIELGPSCTNGTVTGNACSSNSIGISLLGSGNHTLINNTCSGCSDGIRLFRSDNNSLSDNNCSSGNIGMALDSSSNNTLSSNSCDLNNLHGILLDSSIHEDAPICSENTLGNNTCSDNGCGIYLYRSKHNTLYGNDCSSNWNLGILLLFSLSNTLIDNDCSDNDRGVGLGSSNNNTLSDNECTYSSTGMEFEYSSNNTLSSNNCSNNYGGMRLRFSSNDNTLDRNNCSNNNYGISLGASNNNTVSNNNASSNDAWGIYVANSDGITVYHNTFFDNTDHAADDGGSENSWNASYPTGGNYWDNYTGVDEHSGPNQDQPGPDGIGDTPYEIDADSFDYYPLMALPDTPPTASFTMSPSTGDITTLFSFDASGSWDVDDQSELLEVRWDFDGDGEWDTDWSMEKTATHQYAASGIYTVGLEVRDTDGLTGNATATVEVVEAIPEFGSVLVPVLSLLLIVALVAWRKRVRD